MAVRPKVVFGISCCVAVIDLIVSLFGLRAIWLS